MNILITTGIFPPDIGGPATYVPQVADGLARRGHQVSVVALSDRLHHHDATRGYRVNRLLRGRNRPLRILHALRFMLRSGKEADVILAAGLYFESALANLILRRPLVMKVVGDFAWERATNWGWTADDFEVFQRRRQRIPAELLKCLRKWWTNRADMVVVPSRVFLSWLTNWGISVPDKRVIHNVAVPMDRVQPKEIALGTGTNIVTVARLVPWKGIAQVIEAISRLDDLGLIVVGDGPQKGDLEALSRNLGIDRRVYFAGSRSHAECMQLMSACEIFVLNSSYEGLPHVLLEAMELGLAVIASESPGVRELISNGETGLLIDGTPEGLESALISLLNDRQLRQRLAGNGRSYVRDAFSLDSLVKETESALISVIKGSTATRGEVQG